MQYRSQKPHFRGLFLYVMTSQGLAQPCAFCHRWNLPGHRPRYKYPQTPLTTKDLGLIHNTGCIILCTYHTYISVHCNMYCSALLKCIAVLSFFLLFAPKLISYCAEQHIAMSYSMSVRRDVSQRFWCTNVAYIFFTVHFKAACWCQLKL